MFAEDDQNISNVWTFFIAIKIVLRKTNGFPSSVGALAWGNGYHNKQWYYVINHELFPVSRDIQTTSNEIQIAS